MQVKGDKVLVDFTARKNIEIVNAELVKMGVTITATSSKPAPAPVYLNLVGFFMRVQFLSLAIS